MRSEQINQNQIRYTLGADDLKELNIDLKDLAYGSAESKLLFDHMLACAEADFGFSAKNRRLMVEAIPLSDDSLMITLTRVSQEEEAQGLSQGNVSDSVFCDDDELVGDIHEALDAPFGMPMPEDAPHKETEELIFVFRDFEALCELAAHVSPKLRMKNSLYRSEKGKYFLVVSLAHTSAEVRKALSIMNEFDCELFDAALGDKLVYEHCTPVIAARALQKLAEIENGES